jgi:L-alanine-DL-glutamate epimerase-like enolase superfamily enzyme
MQQISYYCIFGSNVSSGSGPTFNASGKLPMFTMPAFATGNRVAIERVRGFAVRLPLPRPVGAGSTLLGSRDYLCLEITRSDGVTGIGFSYIGTRGAESALAILQEMIAPALAGFDGDADDVPSVYRCMNDATRIQGRSGIVLNVISAVDIAMWDASARSSGRSLAARLGATRTRVPAYASGGYYRTESGLEELGQELEDWRSLGFTRMKLKMKGSKDGSEIERMNQTRAALGEQGLLLLDFYHAFSKREDALDFVERCEPFRPYWIEDPFGPDELSSFAWLARRSGQRIATGEFQSSPVVFQHIGITGAASIIQAEAPRCGGVTGWLALADIAEAHGMVMSPCWFHQLHMHLVPAIPHGLFVEYFHGTDVLNFDLLIDQAPQVEAGDVVIPDRPGLGFGFDHDRIQAHAVGVSDADLRKI